MTKQVKSTPAHQQGYSACGPRCRLPQPSAVDVILGTSFHRNVSQCGVRAVCGVQKGQAQFCRTVYQSKLRLIWTLVARHCASALGAAPSGVPCQALSLFQLCFCRRPHAQVIPHNMDVPFSTSAARVGTPPAPADLIVPPNIIERSFTLHYGKGCARPASERGSPSRPALPGEDVAVARHKNGICVVCLSPSHPIVRGRLPVKEVTYRNGLVRPVQGKRKRGGAYLEPQSAVASIVCETGETFVVSACVNGVLVEVNSALESNPGLVATKPLTNGYLAVILPSRNDLQRATNKLSDCDPFHGGGGSGGGGGDCTVKQAND